MLDDSYLSEDYRHNRVFHSIALCSSKLTLEEIIFDVFDIKKDKLSEEQPIHKWIVSNDKVKSKKIEIFRTITDIPFDFAKRWDSKTNRSRKDYSYYIYFSILHIRKGYEIILISCPFLNMAKYLCANLHENHDRIRGKGIYFQRLNIGKTIQAFRNSLDHEELTFTKELQKIGSELSMKGLLVQIFGDPLNKIIGFKGDNVPLSETYKSCISSLENIRTINFSCNLLLSYKGRSGVEIDRFGRFSFRIAKSASNMGNIYALFKYLVGIEAINQSSKIPHIQSATVFWKEQDQSYNIEKH